MSEWFVLLPCFALTTTSMKQRGVAIRGLVPLMICASAAARMPLAGKVAYANHAILHSCRRGSTLFPKGTNGKRHWVRRLPHGRREAHAAGAALRFSSSAAADGDLPDEELDALVKSKVTALQTRPRVAVVGAGFAGLATAYHLARFGSDVTVFDPNEAGAAGASSVAAGLLHPLTPRGKLIWKGEEGYKAAKQLIEIVNDELVGGDAACDSVEGKGKGLRGCVTADNVYRPLMDDKQLDLFTKAAEELPQWVESLTREELMEAVPGSTADCLGGVRIRGALAVDAPAYLKGLWAACCGLLNTSKSSSQDSSGGGDSAVWVRRNVEDIHALAASGDYNAVVACVGAGVRVLAGVKDIVSLRFVRGQSLLYDNVKEAAVGGAGGETGSTAAAEAKGDSSKLLHSAVLCGQYVVPSTVDETGEAGGNGGKILLGSTQEHVMSGQQVDKPPDMAKALRQLRPKVAKFFPALEEVEPVGVTSGVRVLQDRNSYGRIPIAGRLPFSKRGWVLAALGARGLIHHAYLGKLVAACALLDSDERLPPQVIAPLEDLGKESTGDL